MRDNAAFVDRISNEHGSFGRFLAAWPADDQVGLTAYLGKHGSRLGGNTGAVFPALARLGHVHRVGATWWRRCAMPGWTSPSADFEEGSRANPGRG